MKLADLIDLLIDIQNRYDCDNLKIDLMCPVDGTLKHTYSTLDDCILCIDDDKAEGLTLLGVNNDN